MVRSFPIRRCEGFEPIDERDSARGCAISQDECSRVTLRILWSVPPSGLPQFAVPIDPVADRRFPTAGRSRTSIVARFPGVVSSPGVWLQGLRDDRSYGGPVPSLRCAQHTQCIKRS